MSKEVQEAIERINKIIILPIKNRLNCGIPAKSDIEEQKDIQALETVLSELDRLDYENFINFNRVIDLSKELKQRDKIISKMTKTIIENKDLKTNYCANPEAIYCRVKKQTYKNCGKCIKQYFKNKVEEDK